MNWEFASAFQYYNKYQYANKFEIIKLEDWQPGKEIDFLYLYTRPSDAIKNKLKVHNVFPGDFIVYRYK